jgi:hypothetical protein
MLIGIGRKATGKESTWETKQEANGYWRDGIGWCGMDWSGSG